VPGAVVQCNYGGEGSMYGAKITAVHDDGTYDVEYDDGDAESFVSASMIEAAAAAPPPPSDGEGAGGVSTAAAAAACTVPPGTTPPIVPVYKYVPLGEEEELQLEGRPPVWSKELEAEAAAAHLSTYELFDKLAQLTLEHGTTLAAKMKAASLWTQASTLAMANKQPKLAMKYDEKAQATGADEQ
jgi:hypothetical protein